MQTLDKKLIAHITAEIVVVAGLAIWVNKKNSDLNSQLQMLTKKVEEQSSMLKQHEQMIQQLISLVDTLSRQPQPQLVPQPPPVVVNQQPEVNVKRGDVNRKASKKQNNVTFIDTKPKVVKQEIKEDVKEEEVKEDISETESELDAELEDELNELGMNLKKQ